MRIVAFRHNESDIRTGVVVDHRVIDVGALGYPSTLEGWLAAPPAMVVRLASVLAAESLPSFPLPDVRLEAPIGAPSKIIAIGVNYLDHCREQGIDPPAEPLVFAKLPSSLIGPYDAITWDPSLTQQVDPEIELAVVIGRRCRAATVEEALSYVFGYTVVNDVSARDLQFGDGQWTRGKSLDTFCPVGPAIVTADEIPDPQSLRLRLWVNDRLQQDGTTARRRK
jgi:2-keto-4-pentenoate hydratase/2-oxohepta-3-ene-1,7-dioic acid hydratase in catechol pathway